jgi:hypothetical protein
MYGGSQIARIEGFCLAGIEDGSGRLTGFIQYWFAKVERLCISSSIQHARLRHGSENITLGAPICVCGLSI